ncbi:MAG: hypothetical protein JOZ69_02850, partial [Myxococcales bacterium]|nr:hypothetical protein [Myxococcales bacterium]
MSTSLREHLGELAASFAAEVLAAIRGVSLEELVGEAATRARADGGRSAAAGSTERPRSGSAGAAPARSGTRGAGRLARRSADDIESVVERIVTLLRQNPNGLRAEEIRQKLGLQAKELPRPLKEALDSGRLSKSGQKRATTYVLKGSGQPPASAPSKGKRRRGEKSPSRSRRGASRRKTAAGAGRGGARAGRAARTARAGGRKKGAKRPRSAEKSEKKVVATPAAE